ncbi:MAG: hypothetical protein COA78_10995 [Blastopirellula sp.]|nr:MAG: hypothetical protein COA78_10995 [Blastopirellula sp.]
MKLLHLTNSFTALLCSVSLLHAEGSTPSTSESSESQTVAADVLDFDEEVSSGVQAPHIGPVLDPRTRTLAEMAKRFEELRVAKLPKQPTLKSTQSVTGSLKEGNELRIILSDDKSNSEAGKSETETTEETVEEPAVKPEEKKATPSVKPLEAKPIVEDKPEEKKAKPLTVEMANLRTNIRRVLDGYYKTPLDAARNTPWEAMHALLPYGVDANITAGTQQKQVNAIGWICWNEPCKGHKLFYTENGKLGAKQGPYVQGHHGQFLAMMAQSYVSKEYEIRVDDDRYTIEDLIEFEKLTCRPKSELTFKLIALSHYLPVDAEWKSDDGQKWDIERLIKEEIEQPVIGVACGGTHRMTGLAFAVNKRKKSGLPFTGQWARAKKYVEDYQKYTFRLQNPDGSFSTKWFEGRGVDRDAERRIRTTGHLLEWMIYSLPQEELQDPRIVKAVKHLTALMQHYGTKQWGIGPQGHALHALALYDQKVFHTRPGHRTAEIAKK